MPEKSRSPSQPKVLILKIKQKSIDVQDKKEVTIFLL